MSVQEKTNIDIWSTKFNQEPFSSVSSNEWYGVSSDPIQSAKRQAAERQFIDNATEQSPSVEYPKLCDEDLRTPEHTYLKLLALSDVIDGPEGDLLYEIAARKLAELYRHREVVRGLGSIGSARSLSNERAAQSSLELFGTPAYDAFAHILASLRQAAVADGSPYASEILVRTGNIEDVKVPNYELKNETIETLHNDILVLFPQLEQFSVDPDDDHEISPEDSIGHFQAMIDAMGMTGWKAVLTEGKAAETNAVKKQVGIGKYRPVFSPQQLLAIRIHEVLGHGVRGYNASLQEDPLKQGAFPGNLEFEEGLATGLEQIFGGKKRIAGEQYYLSIGLQLGLDQDGKKRGFRDVYEILWRRQLVTQTESDVKRAKSQAYAQVMRTTRGGMLDARDISYFNGSKSAYMWLNEIATLPTTERRAQLTWVLSGKFDPTNPAHAAVMSNGK